MSQGSYIFAPHERPILPGGPHTPRHTETRRWGYVVAALVTGLIAPLGNALVTVNTAALAGAYGMDAANAGWLIAASTSMAVCANLLLVRARQRFGIAAVSQTLLVAYVVANLAQLLVTGIVPVLIVRVISGLTSSVLIGMTVYNMLQVFIPQKRPMGIVLAFAITQLGIPLARFIPIEVLTIGGGHGLTFIELGFGLIALATIYFHPVPPTVQSKAFDPLDFLSLGLFVPAIVLVCAVLAEGRSLWWQDTSWLGWALIVAIPLLLAAIFIESTRKNPLIVVTWVTGGDVIRFLLVSLFLRFVLAEQAFGAVGLLTSGGLNNDQLHLLFAAVLVAMIIGATLSAFMLTPERIPVAILAAAIFIMIGALMDSQSSNLTRPGQLFVSQSLIGFGATLFIGPAMVFGFIRMMKHGPAAFISFIVLFGMTQNVGSLLGAALMGSFQTIQARRHWQDLSSHLLAGNPLMTTRTNLPAVLTRESNILAYNDVFRLIALFSALIAVGVAIHIFAQWRKARLIEKPS